MIDIDRLMIMNDIKSMSNPSSNLMLLVITFSNALLHESFGTLRLLSSPSMSSSFSADIINSFNNSGLVSSNFLYKFIENDLIVTPAAYNSV